MKPKNPSSRRNYASSQASHAARRHAALMSKVAFVGFMSLASCLSAAGVQYQTDLATLTQEDYVPVSITYAEPLEMTAPTPVRLEYSSPARSRFANIPYGELLEEKAKRYELDPTLVIAMAYAESKFKPHVQSPVGAIGLMQVMPETAGDIVNKNKGIRAHCEEHGFPEELKSVNTAQLKQPDYNTEVGVCYARYLSNMYTFPKLMLAAYNAGPDNVRKYGGVPPFAETRDYVKRVTDARKEIEADPDAFGERVLAEKKPLKIALR